MRKYGNVKVKVDNYTFDSKMEADYYIYLKIRISKGEIKYFDIHPKIVLQDAFTFDGKKIQAITYTPDFRVLMNNGETHFIDVKGVKTNEFKIKEKMLKYMLKDNPKAIKVYCVTLHKETWVKL